MHDRRKVPLAGTDYQITSTTYVDDIEVEQEIVCPPGTIIKEATNAKGEVVARAYYDPAHEIGYCPQQQDDPLPEDFGKSDPNQGTPTH